MFYIQTGLIDDKSISMYFVVFVAITSGVFSVISPIYMKASDFYELSLQLIVFSNSSIICRVLGMILLDIQVVQP